MYAEADSVDDFYYTLTVSMNGTDDFEAVDTSSSSESSEETSTDETTANAPEIPSGGGNGEGMEMVAAEAL